MDPSFWRQLIDHVAYPIFVKDRHYRFVFVNRATCEMLRLRERDVLGRTDYDLFPKEQADFFRARDQEMFHRDATIAVEEEPLTDAGGERHVLSTIKAPLHDEHGEIAYLVGIIHDITPMKRAEAELRRANEELSTAQRELRGHTASLQQLLDEKTAELRSRHDQLEAILGGLSEAVIVTDGEGQLLRQNAAARALTGLGDGPGAPRTVAEWARVTCLRWPDGRAVSPEELPPLRALRGEVVHNVQLQLRRARGGSAAAAEPGSAAVAEPGSAAAAELAGTSAVAAPPDRSADDLWVLLSASPLPGGGVVCAVRDVTDLKEVERLKEEFLQVASHELRTPLASLKLLLGAVKAQLKDERGAALLPLLQRGHLMVDRMRRLINDILDASRLQLRKLTLEPRPLDLGQLVREAVERARATLSPDRAIHLDADADELWVRGDGDRIDQVLANLLANASKYGPPGSPITVTCGRREGAAVVAVRDEGPGVPAALRDRIFDRFFQVEASAGRSFGGLGLGLYISREIITAHGGRVWVEGEPGHGSTFFFCLPLPEAS